MELIIRITLRLERLKKELPNRIDKKSIINFVVYFFNKNRMIILGLLMWMIICIIIFTLVFPLATVPTESMEPTIPCGSKILSDNVAYWVGNPQRGDIAVLYSEELDEIIIKRVIGIGGDVILIANGKVFVNDKELLESYLEKGVLTEAPGLREGFPFIVPEGCYFFLGDNRENSKDSRFWENPFVKRKNIRGKLRFVLK